MNAFWCIVRRDLRLALRRGGDSVNVMVFFVLAITLFPFGVGPEATMLARIAPGIIWVAALLAAMLSLGRLFRVRACGEDDQAPLVYDLRCPVQGFPIDKRRQKDGCPPDRADPPEP